CGLCLRCGVRVTVGVGCRAARRGCGAASRCRAASLGAYLVRMVICTWIGLPARWGRGCRTRGVGCRLEITRDERGRAGGMHVTACNRARRVRVRGGWPGRRGRGGGPRRGGGSPTPPRPPDRARGG